MLGNNSQNSSAPNAGKRDEVSRKITRLVDDLPLFPTDINQLLISAVKPSEDGTEILRLVESDTKLRGELLTLARSYFGAPEAYETVEDAVRNIGNFAAHPQKSQSSGEIIDVEPGEAEWNLEVLDMLFDHFYTKPELAKKRRAILDAKLKDIGKPPMK